MGTIRAFARGFWSLVKRYPVRFQAIIVAGLALLTAFGLTWSAAQVGAVVAFTAAVLAFFTEQAVTPIEDAKLPAGTSVEVITPGPAGNPTVTV